MKDVIYRWRVRHPLHGTAFVTAINRYWAVISAAQEWRVPERLGLHAECDADNLGVWSTGSPELDEEDMLYG